MSKVIKNNDGVAIVEGTPAASIIKDVDKFFAAKKDTRMAGEAVKPQTMERIARTGRIDTRPGKGSEEIKAAYALTKPIKQMIDGRNTIVGYMLDGETTMFNEAEMNLPPLQRADLLPRRVKTAMQGGDPRGRGEQLDPSPVEVPVAEDKGKEPKPVLETLKEGSKFSEPAMKTNTVEKTPEEKEMKREEAVDKTREFKRQSEEETTPQEKEMKREEALDKTREFKRLRFAERSGDEQEATRGRFITTLGR